MEETLRQRIKRYRLAAGLSQAALAAACGWKSQSRVGNYEAGSREPTLADLMRLATALGVNAADLILDAAQEDQEGEDRHPEPLSKDRNGPARPLPSHLLILVDEAHRTGGGKAVERLLEVVTDLVETSIGMTATPRKMAPIRSTVTQEDVDRERPHDQITHTDYEDLITELVAGLHAEEDVPDEVQQAEAVIVDFLRKRAEAGR